MNENHRDMILGARVREMQAEARARHMRGDRERPLRATPHPLAMIATWLGERLRD